MSKRKGVKKGAIELSMTTVIVIILGVVLLTLGLTFVRGIFLKIDDLTRAAFANADKDLQTLENIDNELTLTRSSTVIKQGKSDGIGIAIKNLGSKPARFQVKTSLEANTRKKPKFICDIQETGTSQSKEISLDSGERRDFHLLIIDDEKSDIGTYVCGVNLYKDGKEALSDSVRVIIE
ncbi:MAG TPA: hypothetical protein VFE88_00960 [Candidatus Nanoarchaeia archaeon]|nr:hypothetical protein [Candidatus Nanoarchaeia archaeon]